MNKHCDNCEEFKKIKIKVFDSISEFADPKHSYFCSHKCYTEWLK